MLRTIVSLLTMILALILMVPLLVLIFPLWIFVSLCKGLDNQLVSSTTIWQEIIQYAPGIGWKPKAGLNNIYYADPSGDFGSITTGDDGWPCNFSIDESDIVVFGDSFAFGYGSRFEKTFYNMIEEIRVKPVAAPGYNMVQPVQLMKKYKKQLKGKLVIWFICMENDLAENIRMDNSAHYTAPLVKKNGRNGKWEIFTSHIQSEKWLYSEKKSHNTLRYAKICTPSPYSERVFEVCNYLISEAKDVCNSIGAELMIFTIPDKRQLTEAGIKALKRRLDDGKAFNVDLPDIKISNICDELGVPVITGINHFKIEDYKVRDGHWNLKGNKKLAILIEDYYKTKRQYPVSQDDYFTEFDPPLTEVYGR